MKKIYQTPQTECVNGFKTYSIMAGSLTNSGDGNWSETTNNKPEGDYEGEGRANRSLWDE